MKCATRGADQAAPLEDHWSSDHRTIQLFLNM
ncbi:uncharacterized protein METZ01_LOCUS407561 [marine metagenome]|uniref:Uncharacterized protein n=1 Tax=marine metagenome TaxID=408172 RepID=A0A382W7B6_9ZZZZ